VEWHRNAERTAVTVLSMPYNAAIAAGASYNDVGFTANVPWYAHRFPSTACPVTDHVEADRP